MRSGRVVWILLLVVFTAVLGACERSTSARGDRSAEGTAGGTEVVVLPGAGSPAEAWDLSDDLVRLRDSLDAAPDIERPHDPTIRDPTISDPTVGEYRYGDLAPMECSPMPNAWIDLPLCRGR